jgi:hypothetical protein
MGGMHVRTVALVGALALTLGWALGSFVQPDQREGAAEGRASTGPRPLGTAPSANVAPLTEQLRLKLEQKPRAPRPDRNPFAFGGRRAAPPVTRRVDTPEASDSVLPEPPPEPVRPGAALQLAGMASTDGPNGPTWTAMVHDGRGLLYVQQGDPLPGGFTVVDIQESSVTIRDTVGGERTLRLR